ncbi:MAG: diguanylate cyclase, partial [Gemmatimonadota bacterium]
MIRHVGRRLLAAVPLAIGVATVTFILVHLAPGDATSVMVGPGTSPEVLEQVRRNFGLDQPLPVQYV